MRYWIIYILVQISFFEGLLWCVLASAFFKFVVVGQPWWSTFLLSLFPTIDKVLIAGPEHIGKNKLSSLSKGKIQFLLKIWRQHKRNN